MGPVAQMYTDKTLTVLEVRESKRLAGCGGACDITVLIPVPYWFAEASAFDVSFWCMCIHIESRKRFALTC